MVATVILLSWPSATDVEGFIAGLSWPDVKHGFDVGNEFLTRFLYLLGAIAVIIGLLRLGTILRVLGEFRKSRGPMLDLYDRIDDLKTNVIPAIDTRMQALQKQIKEQIEERLQGLQTQLKEQVEDKLVDLEDQLDQRNQIDDAKTIQTAVEDRLPALDLVERDDSTENLAKKWKQFQDLLRSKVPNADMRRIGDVATRLMDRRRNNPLSDDDVKLIVALAGQYRRYMRVDSVTAREAAEFSAAVDKAFQRVQQVGQRPATNAAA
jgi:hypothetical protein